MMQLQLKKIKIRDRDHATEFLFLFCTLCLFVICWSFPLVSDLLFLLFLIKIYTLNYQKKMSFFFFQEKCFLWHQEFKIIFSNKKIRIIHALTSWTRTYIKKFIPLKEKSNLIGREKSTQPYHEHAHFNSSC